MKWWLWCFPPGVRLPVGFPERVVGLAADPDWPGTSQRPMTGQEAEAL